MFSNDDATLKRELIRRGFTPHFAQNAQEARTLALELIANGSVGFGGSVTVTQLGLYEALKARGNEVFSHTFASDGEKDAVRRKASGAQWYIASTNALTVSGELVNIDGSGNRVSSMIMGPENVLLMIGKNKLCDDVASGIERIKRETCPKNARRLHLDTLPCGQTGKCANCTSPERMCRVTSIIEFKPRLIKSFHLVLIDEDMGW